MFYWLAMSNTADVTGGKPIAVLLQPISGVSANNPFGAFYDILEGKRDLLFNFSFISHFHNTPVYGKLVDYSFLLYLLC
jgi:hypothetical protein